MDFVGVHPKNDVYCVFTLILGNLMFFVKDEIWNLKSLSVRLMDVDQGSTEFENKISILQFIISIDCASKKAQFYFSAFELSSERNFQEDFCAFSKSGVCGFVKLLIGVSCLYPTIF
jgi:hypothetical protein